MGLTLSPTESAGPAACCRPLERTAAPNPISAISGTQPCSPGDKYARINASHRCRRTADVPGEAAARTRCAGVAAPSRSHIPCSM